MTIRPRGWLVMLSNRWPDSRLFHQKTRTCLLGDIEVSFPPFVVRPCPRYSKPSLFCFLCSSCEMDV
uniref:Uncharacterized protein n=1 Tax=Aegilops tauschii subsp. strangulata TaxID=200361 RepID=A0A453HMW5_AEGTS